MFAVPDNQALGKVMLSTPIPTPDPHKGPLPHDLNSPIDASAWQDGDAMMRKGETVGVARLAVKQCVMAQTMDSEAGSMV